MRAATGTHASDMRVRVCVSRFVSVHTIGLVLVYTRRRPISDEADEAPPRQLLVPCILKLHLLATFGAADPCRAVALRVLVVHGWPAMVSMAAKGPEPV